jgi:hypothetical protein
VGAQIQPDGLLAERQGPGEVGLLAAGLDPPLQGGAALQGLAVAMPEAGLQVGQVLQEPLQRRFDPGPVLELRPGFRQQVVGDRLDRVGQAVLAFQGPGEVLQGRRRPGDGGLPVAALEVLQDLPGALLDRFQSFRHGDASRGALAQPSRTDR